jgi:small subunit ribosomal protein S20
LAQRHPSALKRHRQNEKRAARNRSIRSHFRRVIRELRETIASHDVSQAETKLRTVMTTLDKAVTKGVIHRNSAARHISRLSQQIAALRVS